MPTVPVITLPQCEVADIYAIKALSSGTANESQQKRALDWIVQQAASTYDLSFRPGDPHSTAFAEGRRFVGLEVVRLLNMKHEQIELLKNKGAKK